jgi:hypothetical protein
VPHARGSRGRFVLGLRPSFSATDFIDRIYKHAHRALVPSTLRSTTARNRSVERERVPSTTQLRRCRIEVRDTPSFGSLRVDWVLRWTSRRILKPRDAGWRSESGPAAYHWHSAAARPPCVVVEAPAHIARGKCPLILCAIISSARSSLPVGAWGSGAPTSRSPARSPPPMGSAPPRNDRRDEENPCAVGSGRAVEIWPRYPFATWAGRRLIAIRGSRLILS